MKRNTSHAAIRNNILTNHTLEEVQSIAAEEVQTSSPRSYSVCKSHIIRKAKRRGTIITPSSGLQKWNFPEQFPSLARIMWMVLFFFIPQRIGQKNELLIEWAIKNPFRFPFLAVIDWKLWLIILTIIIITVAEFSDVQRRPVRKMMKSCSSLALLILANLSGKSLKYSHHFYPGLFFNLKRPYHFNPVVLIVFGVPLPPLFKPNYLIDLWLRLALYPGLLIWF
jgi:hypothetical protein